MTIYERVTKLDDDDLIELARIVWENKNKNARWDAFKDSYLKEKLQGDYNIKKSDFLWSDGIESITRTYTGAAKQNYKDNIQELRNLFVDKVNQLNRPQKKEVLRTSSEKQVPIEKVVNSKLIECTDCGKSISKNAASCPNCGNPVNSSSAPQKTKEKKIVNKQGNWCPNCGSRNSIKTQEGGGCLLLGILFISVIGILFIPFLPKSWKCLSCGNIWK